MLHSIRRHEITASSLTEYALLAALIAGVAVAGVGFTGSSVNDKLILIADTVDEAERRNLLGYTEEFDNSVWIKSGATGVVANTSISPDGATTAESIFFNSDNEFIFQEYSTSQASTYFTFSVWLRSASPTSVNLWIQQNGGELAATTATLTTDWTRFEVSYTTDSAPTFLRATLVPNGNTPSFDAWGAQLEQASSASTYQKMITQ